MKLILNFLQMTIQYILSKEGPMLKLLDSLAQILGKTLLKMSPKMMQKRMLTQLEELPEIHLLT